MTTIIITFIMVAVLMAAMAIGVIVRGTPLRGSCGGADDCSCEQAGKKVCAKRRAERDAQAQKDDPLVGLRGLEKQ